jgi:hypothetical protein
MGLLYPGKQVFGKVTTETPPTPYTGTWYFYLFMTSVEPGKLYIGLGNSTFTRGGIYHSEDYGDNWDMVLSHMDFGGEKMVPLHILPVLDGFLVMIWDTTGAGKVCNIYRAGSLAGPWSMVLGGAYPNGLWRGFVDLWLAHKKVWVTGQKGVNGPSIHISHNYGRTWVAIKGEGADVQPGEIRVNNSGTKGFVGFAGGEVFNQYHWSNTPETGGWTQVGIAARGYKFGVCWPYIVGLDNTQYWYSSDYGHTGVYKSIPAGMQTTGADNRLVGIDMCPLNGQLILSSPPGQYKGVWLSKDYGNSWEKKLQDLGAVIGPFYNSVMWDPFDQSKCYAWGRNGFFRSDDGGETWFPRSKGLELGQA